MIADAAPPPPAIVMQRVEGCSRACVRRVKRRTLRQIRMQARARKRRVVQPYRLWLRGLARCESGNNPRAVSPGGTYRGLYQFDLQTYASVGGRGDPIDDSRLEQSYRAVLLRQRRGTAPWPVCG